MRISKRQLRRVIKEAWEAERLPSLASKPGYEMEDQKEYEQGYQDGRFGVSLKDNAPLDYTTGYEEGKSDAEMEEHEYWSSSGPWAND